MPAFAPAAGPVILESWHRFHQADAAYLATLEGGGAEPPGANHPVTAFPKAEVRLRTRLIHPAPGCKIAERTRRHLTHRD